MKESSHFACGKINGGNGPSVSQEGRVIIWPSNLPRYIAYKYWKHMFTQKLLHRCSLQCYYSNSKVETTQMFISPDECIFTQ